MATAGQHWWEQLSGSDRRRDMLLAVAVFALSLALLVPSHRNPDHETGPAWAVLALTAASAFPLAMRRRNALAVFAFTAAASAMLRAIDVPTGPPLGPTVALYFLAADGPRTRSQSRATVALVILALLAHAAAMEINGSAPVAGALGFGVLVWGGAWLAGERTRLRREQLDELEQRAARVQRDAERERRLAVAEERARIARDLHDSAGHALNVILVHAGLGRVQAANPEASAQDTFRVIEDIARQTVTEIDQLVGALRDNGATRDVEPPPGLAALPRLLHRHQAAGLDIATRIHGPRHSVPPSVDRSAYRILQEALTNAARHGNGHATVDITVEADALVLTVVNPVASGAGGVDGGGGHGVIGMRERAVLLGGSLDAAVDDGCFRVEARLPFAHSSL
jgi:signal transduction histidine kinase